MGFRLLNHEAEMFRICLQLSISNKGLIKISIVIKNEKMKDAVFPCINTDFIK